jgi:hypothetical protein
MQKTLIYLFVILGSSFCVKAQNLSSFNWHEAKYLNMDETFAHTSQVFVFRKQVIEVNYNDKNEEISQVFLKHYILQVNDADGLKEQRELEIPKLNKSREILLFKARIIQKDGQVYELQKSDIKQKPVSQRNRSMDDELDDIDSDDAKEGETYDYYDLSRLQRSDQLEYLLIVRTKNPSLSGSVLTYQSKIPIQKFEFELNANKEFSFQFKSYNNAPNVIKDSTNKVRSVYHMMDSLVPGIKPEKFSNYNANMRGVIYKLDGYELGKRKNIFTFDGFTKNIFDNFYTVNKKELANIKKVIKLSGIKNKQSNSEKILALENYIKTQFRIINVPGFGNVFNVENMYQYGYLSSDAASKLMIKTLELSKIEHDIVVTCNRFDYRFDKDFQSNYFFDNVLIYLRNEQKYLDASNPFYRLGIVPYALTYNHGLFISAVSSGGVSTGIGKIKFIEAPNKDFSVDDTQIQVHFLDDLKSIEFDLTRSLSGYFAVNFQPLFNRLDAEQRVNFENALVRNIDKNLKVSKLDFMNVDRADIHEKPFIVKATGTSASLVRSNGDTLFFKIGALIGEQTNLYDEENRQLPIEHGFSRSYKKQLKITLPKGHHINNIDELKKYLEVTNEDGKIAAMFESDYKINGDILTVYLEEFYEDIELPIHKYEAFRAVINASADFSKIELIIKK